VRLGDERISHIAHLIREGLEKDGVLAYKDSGKALLEIKRVIGGFIKLEDEIDQKVEDKITSLKKDVPRGSPEWDVLYKKYSEEEFNKLKW